MTALPLSTLLSQVLVAHTIELDNEFERRFTESGGGAWITSYAMWANFLGFVDDDLTVRELVDAVGLPKNQVLSLLGGVERWRYLILDTGKPAKRDGYGSARGVKDDWPVRLTPAGHLAASIWPGLPSEIETRWRQRFGETAIDSLAADLSAVADQSPAALPEFLPVIGARNEFRLELPSVGEPARDLPLVALLARALMTYTLSFEKEAPLALALSANFVRLLDGHDTSVRELPALSGVSKEAVAMSLTFLAKTPYAVVEGSPASKRRVRLTAAGQDLKEGDRRRHGEIHSHPQFGASLEQILSHPALPEGMRPDPEGWRASKPYRTQTEAVLTDPRSRLPHHPMVLHRGGWPDGS